jgi:predicted helicase
MADSTFDTIVSNTLEEVHMIAGAEQTFYYYVYNKDGTPIDLTNSVYETLIFKYGDPSYIHQTLSGSIVHTNTDNNEFYVIFSGSGCSGVYQQQVKITDIHGHVHIPSQGKIVIFLSPDEE